MVSPAAASPPPAAPPPLARHHIGCSATPRGGLAAAFGADALETFATAGPGAAAAAAGGIAEASELLSFLVAFILVSPPMPEALAPPLPAAAPPAPTARFPPEGSFLTTRAEEELTVAGHSGGRRRGAGGRSCAVQAACTSVRGDKCGSGGGRSRCENAVYSSSRATATTGGAAAAGKKTTKKTVQPPLLTAEALRLKPSQTRRGAGAAHCSGRRDVAHALVGVALHGESGAHGPPGAPLPVPRRRSGGGSVQLPTGGSLSCRQVRRCCAIILSHLRLGEELGGVEDELRRGHVRVVDAVAIIN